MRKTIGGSAAAAIYTHPQTGDSLHDYLTAYELQQELLGHTEPKPGNADDWTDPLWRGNQLEHSILRAGRRKVAEWLGVELEAVHLDIFIWLREEPEDDALEGFTGVSLPGVTYNVFDPTDGFKHPAYPFLTSRIDATYQVTFPDGCVRRYLADAKHTSQRGKFGAPGTDEVPMGYFVQGIHNYAVCSQSVAFRDVEPVFLVVAVTSFRNIQLHPIQIDPERVERHVEVCARWWEDHIKGDLPVAPQSVGDATARFPANNGAEPYVADASAHKALAAISAGKRLGAIGEAMADRGKRDLLTLLGEKVEIKDPEGGFLGSYKANKNGVRTFRPGGAYEVSTKEAKDDLPGAMQILQALQSPSAHDALASILSYE